MKQVFKSKDCYPFYGATNPLSNFYQCEFAVKTQSPDIIYNTVEQAFQHTKSLIFCDYDIADKIMENPYNPAMCKKLGRKVKGFNSEFWNRNRERIMIEILLAKFMDDKELKDTLISIDKKLIEASPTDYFWGAGISMSAFQNETVSFSGLNKMGEFLTAIRQYLIEETTTPEDFL